MDDAKGTPDQEVSGCRLDEIKKWIIKKGWCWSSHYAPREPSYMFGIQMEWLSPDNPIGFGTSNLSELDAAEKAAEMAGIEI